MPKTATKKTATKKSAATKKTPLAKLPVEEMPTEEIWALYRRAVDKPDAEQIERIRNILMERHYPLVKYIAERLLQTLPKSIEIDDLVSAGLFGLMDAIDAYDTERGVKASKIDKALQRLTGEYGREPTHSELAQNLEMDHAELSKEIQGASAKAMYSLSDKWEDRDDDSSMEKVDVLEDKKSIDPLGELHKADMMGYITRSLTHKERFIIEQYYQVGHTMREIGEMLSLTESRVCQIHSNVMGRLKSLFGSKTKTLLR